MKTKLEIENALRRWKKAKEDIYSPYYDKGEAKAVVEILSWVLEE